MRFLFIFAGALSLCAGLTRAAEPGDCGTVVVPANADITSFSPLYASSVANAQVSELLYRDLIWVNRYAQIDWSRSVASAVASPDHGTTFDVTLKLSHWSDGVPVTSDDVLYTFKLIEQMGTTYPGYGSGGMPDIVKSLTATDPQHFQVVLKHPVNPTWFIYNGLGQLSPLPSHAWAKYTIDQMWQMQSTPSFFNIVDGPMKILRLDIGQDAILAPNPAFDGPKPHLDRLVLKFISSDGAAVQQIEAGDIDLTSLPTELYASVQHLPGVHLEELSPASSYDYLALSLHNPAVSFFDDVRVRDAMQDAQNQPAMIKLVLHGFGTPVYTAVPPADAAMLAPTLQHGDYPVGYDPRKARELLHEAGYAPGPDGIMQKDAKRLSFVDLMTTGSSETVEMTELLQQEFRDVGIEMKVREVEFNQMLALMNGPPGGWQSGLLSLSDGGYPSGEGLFQTGAFMNTAGYSDKTMDRLIDASVNKPGLDGLFAYEIYASAQQPQLFIASPSPTVLVSNRLHGVNDFYDPSGQISPEQLYCTAGDRNS